MEVTDCRVFALDESSQPGEVRRAASALTAQLGGGESDAGRVALVVAEAATNVLKHGGGGELMLYGARDDGRWCVGMIAVDSGSGMHDAAACLEDGMSTAGTAGTGLGAIRRLATTFDLHTCPTGTAVFAEVSSNRRTRGSYAADAFQIGAVRVPCPGEDTCGDDWAVASLEEDRCVVMLADGLGHGPYAVAAAEAATALFRDRPGGGPAAVLALLHDGLRGTRGAAVAVAELDPRRRTIRFAGIGNVAGCIRAENRSQSMVSHHGTLGHRATRFHEFTYDWPRGALVILHSDGISARWDLSTYAGLANRHPMVVAAVLYRDHRRRNDDASIVVLREAA
jgi:anti-sigma regulatory factor (Ser/Thr protein kinase)